MKVLDLKEKLFKKALMEWVESMDSISPEEIYIKIEDILQDPEKEITKRKIG